MKKGRVIFIDNINIPLSQRYCLTIKQATEYFGIGEKKLRKIIDDNRDSGLFLQNGNKCLVKRKMFEEWINGITAI